MYSKIIEIEAYYILKNQYIKEKLQYIKEKYIKEFKKLAFTPEI